MSDKNYLAIEASSSICSVALRYQGQISQRSSDEPRAHTQYMMQFIDELLQEQQLSVGDLDAIVFAAGPGSFTGVRLAAAVAKSLAYAADIPVVGVSSLAALAQAYYQENPVIKDECLVVVDARMDEYYVGNYEANEQGVASALQADALLKPEQLQELESSAKFWLSDGSCSSWVEQANHKNLPLLLISPSAEYLFQLADQQELSTDSALTEQVNYLRGKSGWKNLEQQKNNPVA